MTIGAVLAALQEELPDVTISKIRFLESEGLVTPQRTGSGYRTFTEADLDRLRYILTAQRDRFWPLKVIREALDAMDRGLEPARPESAGSSPRVPRARADRDLPRPADLVRRDTLRLTARELRTEAGLDPAMFEALQTFGLLRADGHGHYGEAELAVARAAGGLAAYGIEARHLRPFRTAADREIGLVEQVVAPMRGGAKGKSGKGFTDPTPEILALCIALHAALVRAGLGD